jgi:hypothetical protein
MNHFLEYLVRPENVMATIFILILWTLCWIVTGIVIGVALCSRAEKKIKHDNSINSFDDFIYSDRTKPVGKGYHP